jgi:hypothetical protein
MTGQRPIVDIPTKSVGLAILLTVLLGPLGMLYATIGGAVVMILVSAVLGVLTFGLSVLFTWPISIIWSILAVNSYNRRLLNYGG